MNGKIEWVLAPREPTEAMWNAGKHFCDGHVTRAIQTYAAMLAFAPKPEAQAVCTCPSGDGSLRWPCPSHPASHDAQQPAVVGDGVRSDGATQCTECGGWNLKGCAPCCALLTPAATPGAASVAPPSAVVWHPIETAPKDNKRPLYLAQFNDAGELIELDWDASWEAESESWEMPQVYYIWRSANGRVEEPTHWAYQDAQQPAVVGDAIRSCRQWIEANRGTDLCTGGFEAGAHFACNHIEGALQPSIPAPAQASCRGG